MNQSITATYKIHRVHRFLAGLLGLVLLALSSAMPQAAEPWRWQNVERIVAVGDVHGSYDRLTALLRRVALIDTEANWTGGKAHLVSTGDLIDRGPGSRQVLELMMKLQGQALAAGGRVHVLLGNHELMNLTGDLRYVSRAEFRSYMEMEIDELVHDGENNPQPGTLIDRYGLERQVAPRLFAHRLAFSAHGRFGSWLRDLPYMIVINDTIFVHGGLPAWLEGRPLADINRELTGQLHTYQQAQEVLMKSGYLAWGDSLDALGDFLDGPGEEDSAVLPAAVSEAAARLLALQDSTLFGTGSPLWYRGTAACNEIIERSRTEAILAGLGARRVVVGHTITPTRRVTSRMDGHILMIDTAMSKRPPVGQAAALIIDTGRVQVSYLDTQGLDRPLAENTDLYTQAAFSNRDEVEDFLATAAVISSEVIPDGITRPKKLRLRKDGRELDAIFKTYDERDRGRNRYKNSDSYRYDVAAYRLDKLLDLNMVPVSVVRTIDRSEGAMQVWVHNSLNKHEIITRGLNPAPKCPLEEQFQLMYAFDYMISNDDRNQTNMLYSTEDWNLVLIDHSRAFRNRIGWPKYYSSEPALVLSQEYIKRLTSLNEDVLERELGGLLKSRQIRYVLKRRDKLLESSGTPVVAYQ